MCLVPHEPSFVERAVNEDYLALALPHILIFNPLPVVLRVIIDNCGRSILYWVGVNDLKNLLVSRIIIKGTKF